MPCPETDFENLRARNLRFIHNFVSNDVASHDATLHPRFLGTSSNDARRGRNDCLRHRAHGFRSNKLVRWDTCDERIDVFGDVALVRATNKHIHLVDGAEVNGHDRLYRHLPA